ncbi:MAG: hypothetical protein DME04_25065 [Candidatus Rokuibacteriota bacterium]|nr:MAG: hypothetical protein DME04_25065 [Candidatus Rokubacteria bacterium]
MIPTAPLRARNRLAELILAALADAGARDELAAIGGPDERATAWLVEDEIPYRHLLRERAHRACTALASRPPGAAVRSRADGLAAAATLFDAYLYFEVHELLEGFWRDAHGDDREALQGLIQVAVGYQHLANSNYAGARVLLEEGSGRLLGRRLDGIELEPFAHAVRRSLARLLEFDWRAVPPFPSAALRAVRRTHRKETS